MKVLLLGDASNYHNALSRGLARAGVDVTLASEGSRWMDTRRDIDITRGRGRVGGALLWLRLATVLASRLKGYDVVQLCGPTFMKLRPHRLKALFDRLKRDNGAVYVSAVGNDPLYVRLFNSPDAPLRYSEWLNADGTPTRMLASRPGLVAQWTGRDFTDYTRHVADCADGIVTALYELHRSWERFVEPSRLAYGGIPVDTQSVERRPMPPLDGPLRVFAAYHSGRAVEKGMDVMLDAMERYGSRHPGVFDLRHVSGLRYDEFVKELAGAHVVLDQLYSYTPATTALLTMALGRVSVSGGEPEYYDFIGERELRPVVNADPADSDAFVERLAAIAADPGLLNRLGDEGRRFVERHNSADVVARRFIDLWTRTKR